MAPIPVLEQYPEKALLDDGSEVKIRPLVPEDKIPLLKFFEQIPETDRFYLKENVGSPEVVHRWTEEMDQDRVLPLVAVVNGKIVADGSLHRSRSRARRHVGEVRIVVDHHYRQKGLGTRLVQELTNIATDLRLEKLMLELVDRREDAAVKMAEKMGFKRVAILPGRIKDMFGASQDLVIMEKSLEPAKQN